MKCLVSPRLTKHRSDAYVIRKFKSWKIKITKKVKEFPQCLKCQKSVGKLWKNHQKQEKNKKEVLQFFFEFPQSVDKSENAKNRKKPDTIL